MIKIRYKKKIKIAYVTTELTPLAKAGGLGDVAGYLPKIMVKEFPLEARIFMACYKTIDFKKYPAELIIEELKISMPDNKKKVKISVWKTFLPDTKIPVYLIDFKNFFNKKSNGLYLTNIGDYYKDVPYFLYVFISKAVLEIIKAMDWHPDVIHYHDGFEAMISKWIKTTYSQDPFIRNIATVTTIHNLASQPKGLLKSAKWMGLRQKDFNHVMKITGHREINLMGEAIDNADMVNTVSPTYAKEILKKKFGRGLSGVLKINKKKFTGIINGIDYHDFDPRTNNDTPVKYGRTSLDLKVKNKLFLQRKFGLKESTELPLICAVSRIVGQKGLDLINDVMKEMLGLGAQFIILGSGWKELEQVFTKAEKDYPQSVAAEMKFDGSLAQTIYAGADIFLMPSRFEPCGLSQIIAMRFGTIPVVRKTGGLADTVKNGKTGFVFKDYNKEEFLFSIKQAVEMYLNDKKAWRKMQLSAMAKDFSWKKSAKKYMWLYRKAIRNHKEYLIKLDKNKHE